MSKEFNPEADVKAQIERLLLEMKELRELGEQTKDPKAAGVLEKQVEDLRSQVEFLRRRLPEAEAE
jgi:hypothetical protein